MKSPAPLPANEPARLASLRRLHLLDTPVDPEFDQLVELACLLLKMPMGLISLVDEDRQWSRGRWGLAVQQSPRDTAFCNWVVADGTPLVVADASQDPRFAEHPLVTGEPGLRFYAGVPLCLEPGLVVGVLAVLDSQPRTLNEEALRQLELLAGQARALLRLRRKRHMLNEQALLSDSRLARYQAITQGAAAGIVRIDGRGLIQEINDYALNLLGYRRDEVLGHNVSRLMPARWAPHHDHYIRNYLEGGEARVIGKGRRVAALHRNGHSVPVHLAVGQVHQSGPHEHAEFIGILTDLSEMHSAEQRERRAAEMVARQQQLLSVLHKGLTDYHALMSGNRLWAFLQDALRTLTGSDYSLIGEVLPAENGPALKVHAITDLSWSEASRQLMQRWQAGEMLLTNPDSMLGRVFAGGETVLSNDLAEDPRRGGFPPGHPPLHNFLGVPILDDGEVIGMFAIANGRDDYSQELVAWLEPFTSTCALLINLYRQLNERDAFTEQLRQTRDEAERASRAKTEFLSSMSHELRTPLNAIMGFAQLLLNNQRTPLDERQHRQVEQIYKSGNHLLTLINEVLDLARIEAGRIDMSFEAIEVADVVREACDILSPMAQQQHIRLQPQMGRCGAVTADYTRLKQVLLNLLSNAIKYNRPQGQVHIGCRCEGERLRISVRDTGPGIAADKLSQLFQPFNRLGAENGAIEGTGVGLALTKRIVEQMQGEIGVETVPGEGCEFWFCLPLATPAPAALTEALPSRAPAEGAGRTVLYVEDNPANQRLLSELFEPLDGVELTCVPSAELAFEMACASPPSLILMDINLPGMSGLEAALLLGRHPRTRQVPVVALSARAMPEELNQARQAGFRDYLTKPVDLPRLLALLETLTGETS
ncbi:multi-sensor hybrid histidine kinase [Oceanimonas sp. GK1]|uniref:GAF domain-containing protein n=1 Tax=Oceanimonas sp. (strain GK1 / IBRC-M 10197) TaxID=511062 RepID=UPI0002494FDB|nr:GAF domain-containing protein [Oceanimonas sp. GK1]AEY02661.1 multi-sensor hybrid histidine kinase [Oceanimonas sp. GK1]